MVRRLMLVTVVGVAAWLASASVAWGDSITPMCTVGHGAAQPCSTGWYTSPVFVSWTWSPLTTGSGSCQAGPYDTDSLATVSCTVTWTDGFTGTQSYTVQVETSSPTATVAPSRSPDSAGWYNHAVTAAVAASSFSGIASCTSTSYAGPSTAAATLFATCADNAGKSVTVASAPFAFDVTPPSLSIAASTGDKSVSLTWQTSLDIAPMGTFVITRIRSGGHAGPTKTVYSGNGNAFTDTHVRNGVHYTYAITAVDQAGNASTQTITETPGARLLAPAPHARLSVPPMLSWTPIVGASYYNVQLYRGDRKILSVWPTQANLQLRRTWRFQGRRSRLKPGRYRWYVWPGFGKRRAARYGKLIGRGTFVIVR